MKYRICILEDQKLLRKFCQSLDKNLGCKSAYGTSEDNYNSCKACPLAIADNVCFLINTKGLTLGEAVKASLHQAVSYAEGIEILAEAMGPKKEYPQNAKPNEGED